MSALKKTARLAFQLHSWLGLISGMFLLLLGLSGSLLVFREALDQKLNAALLRVEPAAQTLPLDSMYRLITARYPNLAGIAWLNPDAEQDRAYEFRLYQNDGRLSTYDLGLISIDPYTGAIVREGKLRELNTGWMQWLVQFHWSFQLGIPGLLLATIFGITLILSTLTGLLIYRKFIWRMLLFRAGLKWNNRRTMSSSLHRLIGVWTLLFNLIIAFTGVWMNSFSMDPAYWRRQQQSSPANTLAAQSIDDLMLKAQAAMPDLQIKNVYLPTQPEKDFRISGTLPGQTALLQNGNSVTVDAQSGRIKDLQRITAISFWAKVETSFMPLHTGSYGNLALKLIYVALGLTPGLLAITGALCYMRRK